jgi:hypothetical protein
MFEYIYSRNGKSDGFLLVKDQAGLPVFADRADLGRLEVRSRLAAKLAGITKEPQDLIEQNLLQLAASEEERHWQEQQSRRKAKEAQAQAPAQAVWEPDSEARQEAEKLLERPDLLAQIVNVIGDLGVVGERALTALAYLVCTSRLTPRPLYLLCQGEPSSGKSFILETVAQTMPPGIVEAVTDISPMAIFYLQGVSLRNRVLLLGERRRQTTEESIDSTKALRELHESGRLSKLLPVKEGGRLQTVKITLEGCPAILESCSHAAVAPEDLTRAIVCWTDESEEQTRRVIVEFAERKAQGTQAVGPERLEAIWAVQWLLEPYEVVIPFLTTVAEKFPAALPEARRAFVRLAALTEASALLHQRQRKTTESQLWADPDDFRLAWRLLRPWLRNRLIQAPSPAVERLWQVVRQRTGSFSLEDLVKEKIGVKHTLWRAIRYLANMGAIQELDSTGPRKKRLYRVADPDWQPGDLPSLELEADEQKIPQEDSR